MTDRFERMEETMAILKFARWLGKQNYLNMIGRDYSVTNLDPTMVVEEYIEERRWVRKDDCTRMD